MNGKDIEAIYEFYRNAQTIEDHGSNSKYTPGVSHPKYSAGFDSLKNPGARGMVTTPVPEAEEDYGVTVSQIKAKIQELLEDAEEKGMTYAQEHLMELLKFIK
jgi:hypothetical protein